MTELPENVTLDWLGRQFMAQRDDLRGLRTDMDMLIRLVTHSMRCASTSVRCGRRTAIRAAALSLWKATNRDPYSHNRSRR
jgi:hypothetical protein